MIGQMDEQTYYNATQGIWTCGLQPHVLQEIMGCKNDRQKDTMHEQNMGFEPKNSKSGQNDNYIDVTRRTYIRN